MDKVMSKCDAGNMRCVSEQCPFKCCEETARVVLCAVQVCAGWRSSGSDDKKLGKCVTTTVRYVPSYSTKLECQTCADPWQAVWKLSTAADAWNDRYGWPNDPLWTESDWPLGHPDLQLYLHESAAVEDGLLIAGFLVTAAVGAASYAARLAFAKHQAAWNSQM
jgi:nicastrin